MNNIRIKHFHDENRRLVATIATQARADGLVAVGTARVHKKDVPNRKFGRHVAEERLQKFLNNGCLASSLESEETGRYFLSSQEALVRMIKDEIFTRPDFGKELIEQYFCLERSI